VGAAFTLNPSAYNLVRLPKLLAAPVAGRRRIVAMPE
jgi:hypothetical protein